eukprot:CAMPEP_0176317130 /NCGR_PEP_ID=MMETSP0121_2-20121125/69086_1 /TAXON_ID=160619 /ORGANISM="Kryptoperidinium foliaceum, Strain CCMP 1326" /LENGTH=299 /DNA_ID=CAMNT_0017659355 /DNA_START=66 /DNA_END=965 /DNA_ORIENTATION=-
MSDAVRDVFSGLATQQHAAMWSEFQDKLLAGLSPFSSGPTPILKVLIVSPVNRHMLHSTARMWRKLSQNAARDEFKLALFYHDLDQVPDMNAIDAEFARHIVLQRAGNGCKAAAGRTVRLHLACRRRLVVGLLPLGPLSLLPHEVQADRDSAVSAALHARHEELGSLFSSRAMVRCRHSHRLRARLDRDDVRLDQHQYLVCALGACSALQNCISRGRLVEHHLRRRLEARLPDGAGSGGERLADPAWKLPQLERAWELQEAADKGRVLHYHCKRVEDVGGRLPPVRLLGGGLAGLGGVL